MKKILYIFDADNHIGFGHLVRCCQIAKELKKLGNTNILITKTKKNILPKNLFKKVICFKENKSKLIDKIILLYKKFNCAFLILDRFNLNANIPNELKKNNINWFQFLRNKEEDFQGDLGICSIPYKKLNFKKKKNIYYGKDYTVLRDQFYLNKKKTTKKKILICFGGGDDKGLTIRILNKIFTKDKSYKFNIITQNRLNYQNLKNWIKRNDVERRIKVFFKSKNIIDIIDESKFAICSGGTISQEIDARCKKMILISVSNNQILQSKSWQSYGHIYVGRSKNINYNKLFRSIIKLKINNEAKFVKKKKNYIKVINQITKF